MSRNWWSNFRGAADWATGNRWDFDNMGRPSSVTDGIINDASDDNDGGYQGGMSGSWAQAFNNAQKWNRNRGVDRPGYLSSSVNIPGAMGQKLSPGKTLVQPFGAASNWGKYQMYHHPQKSGGGIGGMIGSIGGTLLGNVVAPGIGGKIGGAIGGQIGSSF